MAISKTQCSWIALGSMLCLFGVVLICKAKDGNRAAAQSDESPRVPSKGSKAPTVAEPNFEGSSLIPGPPYRFSMPDDAEKGEPTEPKIKINKMELLPPPTPIAPSVTPPSGSPGSAAAEFEWKVTAPPRSGPAMTESNVLADPPPAPPSPAPAVPQPVPQMPPSTRAVPTVQGTPISRAEHRTEGEPPLAPRPGPIQMYHAKQGETPLEIARRTLGSAERCDDVIKLNPNLKPDAILTEGTVVRLPADACIPAEEVETVKPLPVLRKPTQSKSRALPLTGTFPCNLDDKHTLILPRTIRDQLGNCELVLVSPGPDHCLWVTNHAHLERLADRLERSPAREVEVRVFRRLYYAQTEKIPVSADGRVQVPEKLVQFAGLHQEVVLVGIDDHFELWDVTRWKQYTQQKSSIPPGTLTEE